MYTVDNAIVLEDLFYARTAKQVNLFFVTFYWSITCGEREHLELFIREALQLAIENIHLNKGQAVSFCPKLKQRFGNAF